MVITDMTFITNTIDEDLSVESGATLTLTGIVNGDVELKEHSILLMTGIVSGNINVSNGSIAKINGIVSGTVIVNGGDVHITGVIESIEKISGNIHIEKGSYVNGQKY